MTSSRNSLVLATWLVLGATLTAQVPWQIQVRDLSTGQGIPGVMVDARSSRVQGVTDATGTVVLTVRGEQESVTVHGSPGFNYQVGDYPVDGPRIIYLVPDAMFHQTPLIPVTGTTAPIVFQGTTQCVLGPNPYTIEVEVPPGVLPEPASFWIAPVPAGASPLPLDHDRFVAAAIGQFAIKLVGANGKEINGVLADPGIIVRATPTWYPYSHLIQFTEEVKGTQYRLTKTSPNWTGQPDALVWTPSTGMYTAHLRACSWWLLAIPLLPSVLGTADAPLPPPPAIPAPREVEVIPAGCVTSTGFGSTTVTCGRTVGSISSTLTNGGSQQFSSTQMIGVQVELGVAPSELASVITRIHAKVGGTFSLSDTGSVTYNSGLATTVSYPSGTAVAPPCYSGFISVAGAERVVTVKRGNASVDLKFLQGVMTIYCLKYDPGSCFTFETPCPASPPQPDKNYAVPPGLKLCGGDPLQCP